MYLGMKAGEKVADGCELYAVDHPFPWDLDREFHSYTFVESLGL